MAAALKDNMDRSVAELLGQQFAAVSPGFDRDSFVASVAERLDDLELKDRINLLADTLAETLPGDYPDALKLVVAVAETQVGQWAAWPLCSFVERHGVDWPTESLEAMSNLTKAFSCEFAIRPFLEQHLEQTRTYLRRWAEDADESVRRLPSEGTRPLLPWGPKVQALLDDPSIGIELLEPLRYDPSETVRRSVANHLNDVAKADPDLVVEVLTRWKAGGNVNAEATGGEQELDDRMVRHALRTLIKNGHLPALSLLGFTTDPKIEVPRFDCSPPSIKLGSSIELAAELRSTAKTEQLLVVDFVIHHVSASGATSPKVFKWTTQRLEPGEAITLTKKRMIQTASTRRYHAGVHRIELQVAGATVAATEFELTESS